MSASKSKSCLSTRKQEDLFSKSCKTKGTVSIEMLDVRKASVLRLVEKYKCDIFQKSFKNKKSPESVHQWFKTQGSVWERKNNFPNKFQEDKKEIDQTYFDTYLQRQRENFQTTKHPSIFLFFPAEFCCSISQASKKRRL